MNLLQSVRQAMFSEESQVALFSFLLVITIVNVILSINLSVKLAAIRRETSKIEARNESLQTANRNLKDTIKRLNSAVKDNEERIEFLGVQMNQVHDWLGRLTISDFLNADTNTTEIMETLTERVEFVNEERRIKKAK